MANGGGDGSNLTMEGAVHLQKRCDMLLARLKEDFEGGSRLTQKQSHDFKTQIVEIKETLWRPNMLLLCGGFAPEVTAYKRLGAAPIGKVIIQDTDLHAVGVAVAAHPDVEFCIVKENPESRNPKNPGDVRILTSFQVVNDVERLTGGIPLVHFTNPCTTFSLAGTKDGFSSEIGQLLFDCVTVLRNIEASSSMPCYLGENVPSTNSINERFDRYLPQPGVSYFKVCASMCSPSIRKRRFATNRPPAVCSVGVPVPGQPPSLDGDQVALCASSVVNDKKRMVNPNMKKLPCQLSRNPLKNDCIWEQTNEYQEPKRTAPTPEEAERAMGYRDDEIGVTAFSAEKAIRNRIAMHNYKADGCLVSLKGCASDPHFPVEPVGATRRLQLLGNSECVTLLEALMWNDKMLYPPVTSFVEL